MSRAVECETRACIGCSAAGAGITIRPKSDPLIRFTFSARRLAARCGGETKTEESKMEKHKNPDDLWRAYSALAGLAAGYDIPLEKLRAHTIPSMNILLSCLRAAGECCGDDYPE
jgi:hypothetical protein